MLACASDGAVLDAEISTHLWAAVLGALVILTGVANLSLRLKLGHGRADAYLKHLIFLVSVL